MVAPTPPADAASTAPAPAASRRTRPEGRPSWRDRLLQRRRVRLKRLPPWMRSFHALMPTMDRLRASWLGRVLGTWLLRPECWSFKPGPAALGVGVSLFIAWTPTIGLQLGVTLVACCLLRANIPLAMVIPWISNLATAIPIFGFNLFVGLLVMGREYPRDLLDIHDGGQFLKVVCTDFVVPLWVGSILVGAVLGLVGYFATYGFIYWQRQVHLLESLRERAQARARKRQARRLLKERRRASMRLRRQRLIEAARMRVRSRRPLAAPGDTGGA